MASQCRSQSNGRSGLCLQVGMHVPRSRKRQSRPEYMFFQAASEGLFVLRPEIIKGGTKGEPLHPIRYETLLRRTSQTTLFNKEFLEPLQNRLTSPVSSL